MISVDVSMSADSIKYPSFLMMPSLGRLELLVSQNMAFVCVTTVSIIDNSEESENEENGDYFVIKRSGLYWMAGCSH